MTSFDKLYLAELRASEIYSVGDYNDPKKINPCTGKPHKCYRTEQEGMGEKKKVPCKPKKNHVVPPEFAQRCAVTPSVATGAVPATKLPGRATPSGPPPGSTPATGLTG